MFLVAEAEPVRDPVAERRTEPPAIQTGQKLMPLAPINAPIPTSAPQAGISNDIKASDLPKANASTMARPRPDDRGQNQRGRETIFHSQNALCGKRPVRALEHDPDRA